MKFRSKRFILSFRFFRYTRNWMRSVNLGKRRPISLYQFYKTLIHRLQQFDLLDRANGVAFNFILSIFPAIIFIFTLIPYVNRFIPTVTPDRIMNFIYELLPQSVNEAVQLTIVDVISNQRGGLLTFGFMLALFLSTNGMTALMRAFDASHQNEKNGSFIRTRATATALTLMLAFTLMISVTLLVIGQLAIDYISQRITEFSEINIRSYSILLGMRFLIVFVMFFIAISCIYYFGSSVHSNRRFFSVGSLIATSGTLVISMGFSYYITNFGTYNKVYGSIGVLIALMVWIQLITVVLLFGYEINSSLYYAIRAKISEHFHK